MFEELHVCKFTRQNVMELVHVIEVSKSDVFLSLFQRFCCATQGILIPVLLSAAIFNQARPKNRFS